MLVKDCRSFVLAANPRFERRMIAKMEPVGFDRCERLETVEALVERAKECLTFLIVDDSATPAQVEPIISDIRGSDEDRVRFMPIVLLCTQDRRDGAIAYRQMGFDDVIPRSTEPQLIGRQLMQQVDRPRNYYQTSTYLGPDRRVVARHQVGGQFNASWSQAVHFVIQRQTDGTVHIQKKQLLVSDAPQSAEAS